MPPKHPLPPHACPAAQSKQVVEKMMDMLNEGDKERAKRKLVEAANTTRTIWRNKKNIIKEEQLERVKSDQEVFARSRGQNADEPGEEGLVVRDVHPVIHIGSTTMYRSTVTEDEGFPKDFKIKRVPGTETAIIGDPGTEKFSKGSKIMSINGYPASAMTYEMLKRRLGSGSYPYTIELERPTAARDVPTLDDLFAMTEPMLRYNAFKVHSACRRVAVVAPMISSSFTSLTLPPPPPSTPSALTVPYSPCSSSSRRACT